MANILTAQEAANVLRTSETDPAMLDLLPAVDTYIEHATGRDWTADTTIYPEAKAAARMLLVRWHEDPGGMAAGSALGYGLGACLTQLEALALTLKTSGIPDDDLEVVASMPEDGGMDVAITANLVLVFSHEMASSATSAVTLKDASGGTVTVVNSLDATAKILTINPSSSLSSASWYTIYITAAADIYGLTLTDEIRFRTV